MTKISCWTSSYLEVSLPCSCSISILADKRPIFPTNKLSASDFGMDQIATNGKALTVVGLKRSFTLPKALPSGNWEYAIAGTEEHGIEIEWSAYQDATGDYLTHVAAGA